MAQREAAERNPATIPFERFWTWLQAHPNCILRAGTSEVILMDDEDFHWHFATEDIDTYLVQVIRGKRLIGELALNPRDIAYVQSEPNEQEDEYLFDLISEDESNRATAYQFVLSHGFDTDNEPSGRITH